jgi:hypothetical protein
MNAIVSIVMYSESLNPEKATDTLLAWPGFNYLGNSLGIIIDSIAAEETDTLLRRTWAFYSEPFEIIEPFEIARFITPYGKRLDLGLNGFTWVYDVTDYEPLLHGLVDLQAANGQELLNLADDQDLKAVIMKLDDNAKTYKIRARLSGHGEYGPRSCCEWDPMEHYIFIDGEKKITWKIWRDCGMNPVYPQDGNSTFLLLPAKLPGRPGTGLHPGAQHPAGIPPDEPSQPQPGDQS